MDPLELLKSGEDFDLTVTIGDRSFQLHSLVLKSGSKYFRSCESFATVANGGGKSHEFSPDEVDANAFDSILAFIYAKRFKPPEKCTVSDWKRIFVLGDYLQVQGFQDYMNDRSGDASPFKGMKSLIEEEAKSQERPILWLVDQCHSSAHLKCCGPLQDALLDILLSELNSALGVCRPACSFVVKTFFHKRFGHAHSQPAQWTPRSSVVQEDLSLISEVCEKLLAAAAAGDETPLERRAVKRRVAELEEENSRLKEEADKLKKLSEDGARVKEQLAVAKDMLQGVSDVIAPLLITK
jgi:hypothetical protein